MASADTYLATSQTSPMSRGLICGLVVMRAKFCGLMVMRAKRRTGAAQLCSICVYVHDGSAKEHSRATIPASTNLCLHTCFAAYQLSHESTVKHWPNIRMIWILFPALPQTSCCACSNSVYDNLFVFQNNSTSLPHRGVENKSI